MEDLELDVENILGNEWTEELRESLDLENNTIDFEAHDRISNEVFNKLDEAIIRYETVKRIMDETQRNGVSRIAVESICSMFGTSVLPEGITPDFFSVEPSAIGGNIANESFMDALKNINKETVLFVLKVLALLVTIVGGSIAIIKARGDKVGNDLKKANVDTEAKFRKILDEIRDMEIRMSHRQSMAGEQEVSLRCIKFEEECSKKYGDELTRRLVEVREGLSINDLSRNMSALTAMVDKGVDEMHRILESLTVFNIRTLWGVDFYKHMKEIESIFEDTDYTVRGFGFTTHYGMEYLKYEGFVPLSDRDSANFDEYDIPMDNNCGHKFWELVPVGLRGEPIKPIRYSPVWCSGRDKPPVEDFTFSFDKMNFGDIVASRDEFRRFEVVANKIKKSGDDSIKATDRMIKKIIKDNPGYLQRLRLNQFWRPHTMIWPRVDPVTGITAGEQYDPAKRPPNIYTELDMPSAMITGKNPFLQQYSQAFRVVGEMMKDMSMLIYRIQDLSMSMATYATLAREDLKANKDQ